MNSNIIINEKRNKKTLSIFKNGNGAEFKPNIKRNH